MACSWYGLAYGLTNGLMYVGEDISSGYEGDGLDGTTQFWAVRSAIVSNGLFTALQVKGDTRIGIVFTRMVSGDVVPPLPVSAEFMGVTASP